MAKTKKRWGFHWRVLWLPLSLLSCVALWKVPWKLGLRFWVKLRPAKWCPISEGSCQWKPWFKRGFQMEVYIYVVVIQPLSCGDCKVLDQGLPMLRWFSCDWKTDLPATIIKVFPPSFERKLILSLHRGSPGDFSPNCEAFTLAESDVPERVERVAPLRELLEDPPEEDVMTGLEVRIFQQRTTRDIKGES